MEDDIYPICAVDEVVSKRARNAIKRLNKNISSRAWGIGLQFHTDEPLTENMRVAWEQIIRGIVSVM